MRAICLTEVSEVSAGLLGAGSGSFLCEVGQTGMGSNQDYGGMTQTYDDGSSITFDGNGDVLFGYDSLGRFYDVDGVRNEAYANTGRMTDQQAESFVELLETLLGMRGGW